MAQKAFLPVGSIQITNGPGKFDFMLSNFDFKTIELTCTEGGRQFKVDVHVNFAHAEDGSKEKWIGMMGIGDKQDSRFREQRAYYFDTRTRTGHIVEAGKGWRIGAYQIVDNS